MNKKIDKVFIIVQESSSYDTVTYEAKGVFVCEKNAIKKLEELEATEPITVYEDGDKWYNDYFIWEEDINDVRRFKKIRKI